MVFSVNVDNSICPAGWIARAETTNKKECYYLSAEGQETTWQNAFCQCMEKKSILANIVTWEEAVSQK